MITVKLKKDVDFGIMNEHNIFILYITSIYCILFIKLREMCYPVLLKAELGTLFSKCTGNFCLFGSLNGYLSKYRY
jgi:hypothetical protein